MTEAEYLQRRNPRAFADRASGVKAWVIGRLGPRNIVAVRLFLIVFAVVFVVGFLVLTTIGPKYSARAIVGPQVTEQAGGGASGLGAGLGGLGTFLGGKQQSEDLVAFQSLIGTAGFSEYLIRKNHLDKVIFPHGIHHSFVSVFLHMLFGQPVSNEVTTADVQSYIQSNVSVQSRLETPYIELSYANKDRDDAVRVLQTLMKSGDDVLRLRKAASLNTQIEYLSHVLRTTTDIEQLDLFRKILGEKLAAKVLIDTQDTYSFRVFDAPFAPLVPNSPNIAMLMILLILASLFLAMTVTVGWYWWFRKPAH